MGKHTDKLRNLLDRINEGTTKRRRVYGILGRVNADGSRTVRVASDPTLAHVQVQGQQAATVAFHRGAVNLDSGGGQAIIMWREDGRLHIEGYDPARASEVVTSTVYARSDLDGPVPGIFDKFTNDTVGVRTILYLAHITSNDMADHLGGSIQFAIEDDSGVRYPVGFISAGRDGADDSGRLVFTPMDAGVPGPGLIVWSDSTVQMGGYGAGYAMFDANGVLSSGAAPAPSAGDIAAAIHAASEKTTPVDADTVGLVDSADSNTLKKLSWANIKATLKAYFDAIYADIAHNHDGVYSLVGHDHAGVYALVSHNHAASDVTSGTFDNARIAESNVTQHQGAIDHGSIAGLGDDDHTGYARLAGRSGGQTVTGGTAASQSLKLRGTSHATPGDVRVLDRLRVGADSAPAAAVDATAPNINTPAVVARGVASQVAPVLRVIGAGNAADLSLSDRVCDWTVAPSASLTTSDTWRIELSGLNNFGHSAILHVTYNIRSGTSGMPWLFRHDIISAERGASNVQALEITTLHTNPANNNVTVSITAQTNGIRIDLTPTSGTANLFRSRVSIRAISTQTLTLSNSIV